MSAAMPPQAHDRRDVAALTEFLVVLEDVGQACGADGLFVVYNESGSRRYLVDVREGACECDDSFYRDPDGGCKHVRRARFEIGAREIPAWVDRSRVDSALLEARDDLPGCRAAARPRT